MNALDRQARALAAKEIADCRSEPDRDPSGVALLHDATFLLAMAAAVRLSDGYPEEAVPYARAALLVDARHERLLCSALADQAAREIENLKE